MREAGPFFENPDRNAGLDPGRPVNGDLCRVTILDNDTNTYQEVIDICMIALGVSFDHAYKIALAVDNNGKAEVAEAPRATAARIAEKIRTIGIEVVVDCSPRT